MRAAGFSPPRIAVAGLNPHAGDGGNFGDSGAGHSPAIGNAQDPRVVLGKVLRINPLAPSLTTARQGALSANGRYRIPTDNPFAQRTGRLREVFALGLRNPYRMSWDDGTGRLIAADVGQDAVEEVNVIVRGGNYGWPIKEGPLPYNPRAGNINNPSLISPAVFYEHDQLETPGQEAPLAVIGGFVYRGAAILALQGKYVFADLSGKLLVGDLRTGGLEVLGDAGLFIKGIGQDTSRELYVLASSNIGPSGTRGVVLAIQPGR